MCLYCENVVFDFEFSGEKRDPEIKKKKNNKTYSRGCEKRGYRSIAVVFR